MALKTITATLPGARVRGDVNGDGAVTAEDAALVTSYIGGSTTFDATQIWCADVYQDGNIRAACATQITRYVNGNTNALTGMPSFADYYSGWTYVAETALTGYWYHDITADDAEAGMLAKAGAYQAEALDGAVRIKTTAIPPIDAVTVAVSYGRLADFLVTDRTQADVNYAAQLNRLGLSGMSASQLTAWRAGLKGSYNATDLNRVEGAVAYLADLLQAMPDSLKTYAEGLDVAWGDIFAPPYDPAGLSLTTKTDWSIPDIPADSDMARYLANVVALVDASFLWLPVGYTALEYIESNRTLGAYIDTGYYPNDKTRVTLDFFLTRENDNPIDGIFGESSPVGTRFAIYAQDNATFKRFYIGYSQTTKSISLDIVPIYGRHKAIIAGGNGLYINLDGAEVVDTTNRAFTSARTASLFAYRSSATQPKTNVADMRLYSCKIWDGNAPARDFVPCLNPSGVAGLYDIVNGVFYSDPNGVEFVSGPVLSEAEDNTAAAMWLLAYGAKQALPETMAGLDYIGANNIERALGTVEQIAAWMDAHYTDLIDRTAASFVYSGQPHSGQIWTQFGG